MENREALVTPPVVEDKAPEPVVVEPLTWDKITMPANLVTDEALQTEFLDVINKDMTPGERAQALIDLQGKAAAQVQSAAEKSWTDMQETWKAEINADPTIGGEKLAPALGKISQVIDMYGTPELRTVMDMTGAGNNPEVVKFLHKIALQLTEGAHVNGAPVTAKVPLANSLYPTMK